MSDVRTEPRERWVILVWERDNWMLHEQWSMASVDTARQRAAGLQQTRGRQNVRLIHTSDTG